MHNPSHPPSAIASAGGTGEDHVEPLVENIAFLPRQASCKLQVATIGKVSQWPPSRPPRLLLSSGPGRRHWRAASVACRAQCLPMRHGC